MRSRQRAYRVALGDKDPRQEVRAGDIPREVVHEVNPDRADLSYQSTFHVVLEQERNTYDRPVEDPLGHDWVLSESELPEEEDEEQDSADAVHCNE